MKLHRYKQQDGEASRNNQTFFITKKKGGGGWGVKFLDLRKSNTTNKIIENYSRMTNGNIITKKTQVCVFFFFSAIKNRDIIYSLCHSFSFRFFTKIAASQSLKATRASSVAITPEMSN